MGMEISGNKNWDSNSITLNTNVTALNISADAKFDEVILRSDPDNTVDLYLGSLHLLPGMYIILPSQMAKTLTGKTLSGIAKLNWLACNEEVI